MKKLLLFVLIGFTCLPLLANHTKGGWIYYEYLGPGVNNPSANLYRVTLKVYMICNPSTGQLDQTAAIGVFDAGSGQLLQTLSVALAEQPNIQNTPGANPCIVNAPSICYKIATYVAEVELAPLPSGYILAYQRCCRISGIANIVAPSNLVGATYSVAIPGTNVGQNATQNSSPQFVQNDTAIVCQRKFFTFNFSAIDPDGDSLVYELCDAYTGGTSSAPIPNPPTNPPYQPIPYQSPFSGTFPLGVDVNINSFTGLVSGIAPDMGEYIINACVTEYRNGVAIAQGRKELHLFVADCNPLQAALNPNYEFCDDFNVTFQNNGQNPTGTVYIWNFGAPGTPRNIDTSFADNGTIQHQYLDTGRYTVTLTAILNGVCRDSARTLAGVYPGFFPGFRYITSCSGFPVSFFDTSRTRYGIVNYWRWDFGDPNSTADTSRIQNPQYTYSTNGSYTVTLEVGTNKGCRKIITQTIEVLDKPTIFSTNDTLICDIDTVSLLSQANVPTGTYTWTSVPANYGFVGSTTGQNVQVTPDMPTTYYVLFNAGQGCSVRDSVKVDVKNVVALEIGPDTTICLTDTIRARTQSDALYYLWTATPATNAIITTSSDKFPVIQPLVAGVTKINVIGNIGLCQSKDSFNITAVPYPIADASGGGTICEGQSVQLFSTPGDRYVWSPARGLNDPRIQNPIVSPPFTTTYTVSVFENNGCPKPSRDTVTVMVIPRVIPSATNDTTVVIGQPLQLFASGADNVTWTASSSPNWLNNPNSLTPLAVIGADISNIIYYIRLYTNEGCEAFDTVRVRVYKIKPDLFVPTVFSPNDDGLNDILKPIPIGIRKINYFRVFNRVGQLMYSTSTLLQGWDGTFRGFDQRAGTYVWEVEGETYTGERIYKKGYAVLMR